MKNKFISALLALMMVSGSAVLPAAAAEQKAETSAAAIGVEAVSAPSVGAVQLKGETSFNFHNEDYSRWSQTVNSYLTEKSDGTFERVEYLTDSSKLIYEVYSSDGNTLKKSGTINMELDIFGGFFSGSDYNYVVFGKKNSSHSNSAEVLRFVKYSKDWKRQASVSVKGANTAIPFDAGSLRMVEKNGSLYVHTCHEMYSGHQANMTYVIKESNMSVTESNYEVTGFEWTGYVSHSFNQFIKEDGQYLYRVDHGDAYPRSITLTKASLSGSIKSVTCTQPVNLSNTGATGANDTGVSVGGFELSSDKCIIAFNGVDFTKANADPFGKRNIYLSVTGKNLSSTKHVKITNYTASSKINVSTPQLVKINNSSFLLLWEEMNTEKQTVATKLCKVNADGKIDSQGTISTNYVLSDCQPILCKDGMVRWYTSFADAPTLYTVNPSSLSKSANSTAKSLNIEVPVTLEIGQKFSIPKCIKSKSNGSGMSGSTTFFNSVDSNYTVTAKECCSGNIYLNMRYGGKISYQFDIIKAAQKPGAVTLNLTNTSTGLKASWSSVNLAKSYIVYYRLSTECNWSQYSTTATSTTIPNAKPGMLYKVQVQSIGENGVKGEYSAVKSLTYIPQVKPVVTLSNKSNGIRVDWKTITGADKYTVYYKQSNASSWSSVKTTNNYYALTGINAGTSYNVRVRPIFNGSYGLYSDTSSLTYIPQVRASLTLTNKTNGIRADWKAIAGATKYIVYYKQTDASSWTSKETTNIYYLLTGITAGKEYRFRVLPVFGSSNGLYSSIFRLTYIPQIKPKGTFTNQSNGIRAEWKSVAGATKYVIYYKKSDVSTWSTKETTNIYYLFTNLTAGTKYNFQIKPMFGSSSGLLSSVYTYTYIPLIRPAVTLSNKTNGIRAEWKAITGATKYVVYYKQSDASTWTTKETTNIYYPLTGLTIGTSYSVQVKPMFGSAGGYYSSVYKLTYIPQVKPVVTLSNKTNGIRADWKAVTGATKYVVYYKQSDASTWTTKETTNIYFALTGIKAGTNYSIQVKPMFDNLSGAYSVVRKLTYIPQIRPTVTLSNKTNGIKVDWKAITGATKYKVYYKKSGDSTWSSVQTTSCYYTYLNAVKGTNYSFQVQPLFENTGGLYSTVTNITFK